MGLHNDFENELLQRLELGEAREQLALETQGIEDSTDREIALLFRQQESDQAREDELTRIGALSRKYKLTTAKKHFGERVVVAYERAARQGNRSAFEALDRELKRVQEEEGFMMFSMMLLLDEIC